MTQPRLKPEGDGLLSLVRETLDGIGRLVGEHLKLARLEIQADMRIYGRALVTLLLVAGIFALAYGLACVGLALMLSRWMALGSAFFLLAGAHVVIGAAAGGFAVSRLRRLQPMRESAHEVSRSVMALTSAGSRDGVALTRAAGTNDGAAAAGVAGGESWPTIRP